jgi:hypothetical protein
MLPNTYLYILVHVTKHLFVYTRTCWVIDYSLFLKYFPFIWYFGESSKLEKCLKNLKVINIKTFNRKISVVEHHKHHFLIIPIITGLVSFIDTGIIHSFSSWKAHRLNISHQQETDSVIYKYDIINLYAICYMHVLIWFS